MTINKFFLYLVLKYAISSRISVGGTAFKEVIKQIQNEKELLSN